MSIEEEQTNVLIARLNYLKRLTRNLEKAGIKHGWAKEMAALTWVITGLPSDESESDVFLTQIGTNNRVNATKMSRDDKIMEMHVKGYSNREIATTMDLSYQTVYGVVRKTKGK